MKKIIWGAGQSGAYAYWWHRSAGGDILFFVDNENVGARMKWLGELSVCRPDVLVDYKDCLVILATPHMDEARAYLQEIGIENVSIFDVNVYYQSIKDALQEITSQKRMIDLGKFLSSCDPFKIYYVGAIGGSHVLDYALLKGIAVKFGCKNYLEIGTYIGESIKCLSELGGKCHSLTMPKDSDLSLSSLCERLNQPDFTEYLSKDDNIIHHYGDSKRFDYSALEDDIDLYFIDGDHSYTGVYWDTKNVFEHRSESSFVIWHDFKVFNIQGCGTAVPAVRKVLEERGKGEFDNVFICDNGQNICGVYIPPKYQSQFPRNIWKYTKEPQPMYVYEMNVKALQVNA